MNSTTRRLSFSLILGFVATPLVVGLDTSNSASHISEEHVSAMEPMHVSVEKLSSPLLDALAPQPEEAWDINLSDEAEPQEEVELWLRKRRDVDYEADSDEDMVTAEQVLFRPLFRHRQIVEERAERKKKKDQFRRKIEVKRPVAQPSQRKQYYTNYQNYNRRYYPTQPLRTIPWAGNRPQRSVYPMAYRQYYQ